MQFFMEIIQITLILTVLGLTSSAPAGDDRIRVSDFPVRVMQSIALHHCLKWGKKMAQEGVIIHSESWMQ